MEQELMEKTVAERGPGTRRRGIMAAATVLLLALVAVVAWYMLPFRTQRMVVEVLSDFEKLNRAFAEYSVDMSSVGAPADTRLRRKEQPNARLTFENEIRIRLDRIGESGTFGPPSHPDDAFMWTPLSTPIAYVNAPDLADPFRGGGLYAFTSWNWFMDHDQLCVVQSPGPDGRDDYPIEKLRGDFEKHTGTDKRSDERMGIFREQVRPFLYDPTNGVRSGGDMILVWAGSQGCVGSLELEDIWFWRGRQRGVDQPRRE